MKKETIETFNKKYGINIIDDVILADDYHISFCFDFTKREKTEVQIISGDLSFFELEGETVILSDILNKIEFDNPVSEVMGKENYIEYLFSLIENNKDVVDIYFPIKDNNTTLWVVCTMKRLRNSASENLFFGRVNWITYDMPDAIKYYQSNYKDIMTDLFSMEALKYHLSKARNTSHSYGLYFDIDNFKRLNDIFGHKSGDKYLRELGVKFKEFQDNDVIPYRIGGDEFFVYLINSTENEAYEKASQIIYDVERLNEEGQQAEVSASVGIVPIIGNDFDIENLLDLADRTMYHAKVKGKGNISYARDV